jgi:Cu2+-exporting ATPase
MLPVRESAAIIEEEDGRSVVFCCEGCRGVYHLLRDSGFESFYERRSGWQPGPPTQSPLDMAAFSENVTESGGQMELDLRISGIRCASCIWLLENFLKKKTGVTSARVNYATHRAHICWSPSRGVDLEKVLGAIQSIGYTPRPLASSAYEADVRRQRRDLLLRFGTAAFFSMQLMLYTVALYAGYFQGIEKNLRITFQCIAWALTTPVVFYSGYPFMRNSIRSVRHRALNMDTLVFLGSFSAYAYSVVAIFTGGEVFFDTSAMIITLILLGRYIETGAKWKAGETISELMVLQPREARLSDGRVMPVSGVAVGDVLSIIPGEKVPLDGLVLEGSSEVDESMLTGESKPSFKSPGSEIFAGTMNLNGRLLARVSRVGKNTVLSQIIKVVEEAQGRRAPIQALADRVVGWFVPAVLAIAAGAFAFWMARTGDIPASLMNAVSVLVIACPCALGLATPLAVLVSFSSASRKGILFKGGDTFEMASRADLVVFDKTGTLTKGTPALTDVIEAAGGASLLLYAASLEAGSEHPMARVITSAYEGAVLPVEDFRAVPGKGVEGKIRGMPSLLGSREFIRERGIEVPGPMLEDFERLTAEGKTVVVLAVGGRVVGILAAVDALREEAAPVVGVLRGKGIRSMMVTGDNEGVARYLAAKTGIADVTAQVSPTGKADIVRGLKGKGYTVMMVGDGINDAPALVEAHVGVAMGKATDIALESAEIVLMKNDLSSVIDLLVIARRSISIIRQNLLWAFSYNIVAIPLAVSGFLHPIFSALLMASSSLMVVGNSLRLRKA